MKAANFDPIAKPYRWLEYLTLGPALQRCRTYFLPSLALQNNALVLGDGDGRFLARLLSLNSHLEADAVDSSAAMLQLLRHNCETASPSAAPRLHTHKVDARNFQPARTYDLVVTHFFLDCLTQSDLKDLVERIVPAMSPQALWLLSDFRIPDGLFHLPAQLLIRGLYLAFRVLTGLRTMRLPDHKVALTRAGLIPTAVRTSLYGLLTTEVWHLQPPRICPTITPLTALDPQPDWQPPPDPIPDPEPIAPSLEEPDAGVYHHEPGPHDHRSTQ